MTPPSTTLVDPSARPVAGKPGPKPATIQLPEGRARLERIVLFAFVVVPFLAVLAAIPVLWGYGIGWHDIVIAVVMYAVTGHGITVGFHRYFTHGSFRAKRPLRIALAIAGSMAIEGPLIRWVADHRRHHAFADREGDPHSPWRYGDTVGALAKGMFFAHLGWMFDREQTNEERFVPDLLADRDMVRISRAFPRLTLASLALPALVGGLWSMSWAGAATGLLWGGLVRVCVLHHVTWSINSICHTIGEKPFQTRDRSTNVWPLAIMSLGESWHNLHHADPTAARHGVLKGQLDSSARVIWLFEKLGWAYDVRWPSRERIESRLAG
jgi:stearoyl-CoA desaturase (Delta-9 desaturase)